VDRLGTVCAIAKQGIGRAPMLAQGTLYPDVIESVSFSGDPSVTIKSHHNVGGLPERVRMKLVEPLRELFKGADKLAGVLGRLEQRRCRLEQPRDPRSMGLIRRLVCEALAKIAVENGGSNLKQKMSAPL
jgi:hypothetical protein